MKRIGLIAVGALCLFAQTSRDAYRGAYRAWRQQDPNLERDAATLAPTLASRIQATADLAAKYGVVRAAYLRESSGGEAQALTWLEKPAPELANVSRAVRENVAAETAVVKRNLTTFGNDPDPAIQQLKSMLDRENTALAALSTAVAERQAAADAAQSSQAALEQARTKALNSSRDLTGSKKTNFDQVDREAAAWAAYYRKLGEGASGGTSLPNGAAPVGSPIPALPLARYVGAWTFPNAGVYHGPPPEFVDLVVHEENGHVDGTLFARFKLPQASKDDAVLRFDFSGDFKNTRNQVFTLQTSDGARGTIELIPGSAFNLLEVNFQTESKAGKVRRANAVLVKK